MAAERKGEPKLTEATAKTTAALRTLQSRLNGDADKTEALDELGEQLQSYFAIAPEAQKEPTQSPAKNPDDIRSRVIDGAVERILRSWGEPKGEISDAMKNEVIERLVEHILALMPNLPLAPPNNDRNKTR